MHKGAHVFLATLVLFTVSTSALGYALAKEAARGSSRDRSTSSSSAAKIPWYCIKSAATVVELPVGNPPAPGYSGGQRIPQPPTPTTESAQGGSKRVVTNILKSPEMQIIKNENPQNKPRKTPSRTTQKTRTGINITVPPAREPPSAKGPPVREPPTRGDEPEPVYYPNPGYYTEGSGGKISKDGRNGTSTGTTPQTGGKLIDSPVQGGSWYFFKLDEIVKSGSICPKGYAVETRWVETVCLAYLEKTKSNPIEAAKTDPEIIAYCTKHMNPKLFASKINKQLCDQYMQATGCVFIGKEDCPSIVKIFSDAGVSNKEMIKTLNEASNFCAGISAYTPKTP